MSKSAHFSSVYRQVADPTCVDHSMWCNFIHPKYKSLVVIGSTHFEVYNIVSEVNEATEDVKFDHVINFNLNEEVIDASPVRFYGDTLDSIMMSFDEAKVSAIRFDPMTHEIKTIILHNFQFDVLKQYRSQFFKPPMLRIDPEQRCAVVLVYDKFLGIIPFRRSPDIISTSLTTNESKNKKSVIIPINVPIPQITQHELFSGLGLLAMNRPPPTLQSYVTDLNKLHGVKINYILDMKFLNGYYEPTLMILYDPIGTFVGQALTRKDTCRMITLSLNLQKRSNPVIWHVENLPYDCFRIVPVPRPIGGVVLLSTNILIYLNQSQPSCGIGLNGFSKTITNFPLRQTSVLHPMTLDSCECRFINSEQMILVAKTGEIFIVTLLMETAMRTVVGAHIEKNFTTVIPKAISLISPNHIFIGSQITDSVILHYEPREGNRDVFVTSEIPIYLMDTGCNTTAGVIDNQKNNIKSYTFKTTDVLKNIGPIGTLSVAENYGFSHTDSNDAHQLRLANEMGYVELVATTGHGRFGSVSLINFSVKPRMHKTFEMSKDISDMWWVSGSGVRVPDREKIRQMNRRTDENMMVDDECYEDDEKEIQGDELIKNYIILSKQKMTMVLEIGKETVELEKSGFKTDEATLCAGNIGSIYSKEKNLHYPLIYQVLANNVRLLNGSQLLTNLRLETDNPILEVTSSQDYLLLRTIDDLFLVQLTAPQFEDTLFHQCDDDDDLECSKYMIVAKKNVRAIDKVCCFALYEDKSGFIYRAVNYEDEAEDLADEENCDDGRGGKPDSVMESMDEIDIALYGTATRVCANGRDGAGDEMVVDSPAIPEDPEEIERYLYGDNSLNEARVKTDASAHQDRLDLDEESVIQPLTADGKNAQSWAFIVYTDGIFEIYSVPDFTCVFRTQNFFDGCNLMINDIKLNHFAHIQGSYNNYKYVYDPSQRFEVSVSGIGRNKDRPVIFVRNQSEILMYEILAPVPRRARYMADLGDHMRLRKIPLPCLILPVKKVREKEGSKDIYSRERKAMNDIYINMSGRSRLFTPFEDIGGFRGMFVAGSYPLWLFFSRDGHIRIYPMYVEGVVPCFAVNPCQELSAAQCAYFNYAGEMKLVNLPQHYDYEGVKAVKRIPINKTVHFVQYHIDSKTFALITSIDKEVKSIFKLNAENSKEEEQIERDKDIIRAPLTEYRLQFYANNQQTGVWEAVPNAWVAFEDWDKVTCMATVQLSSQMTYSGTKDFLAIGSNMTYGEEIPVRGKIMIVDIIDVVPEPGRMLTRHKIKIIYDVEQKGPVTALTSCKGYLVSAIGQKVYIWELRDNDLVGVAFVDSEIFVHQLHCVRNLIIAGDFLKSIQLLRFQSDLRVLSLVSKDHKARGVMCSNFFVDRENLGFLMTDVESNVIIYSYNPMSEDSRNGKQLIRDADMRLPIAVTCSLRINDRIREPIYYSTANNNLDQELLTQSVYFGCPTGALYRISPISCEKLLQIGLTEKNLSQSLQPVAGLHSKESRAYKFTEPDLANACGNIADGDLLNQYVCLPYSQRIEVAKKAGVEIDKILDDIVDINSDTLHF